MLSYRFLRRTLLGAAILILLYISILLLHGWAADWNPEGKLDLMPTQPAVTPLPITDSLLSLIIWNVGYGGLGAESDFFFDDEGMWYSGSSMIRSPRPLVEKNLQGALAFLKNSDADFFLLQEVDVESDRSYRLPQFAEYGQALAGFTATMAVNYRCSRVPIPVFEPWQPYGKVESGLATFSRFRPAEAVRYQLPGHYPMPDRMFQLDRCAALHRFPTSRGKDLVILNVHNSAYDPGDKIKAIQLPYLRDLALKEYEKGNYVVLGGDWNQCPPFFNFDKFMPNNSQGYRQGNIPADFFPENWRYAYDPTVPTNRKARDPYVKGQTFETLIDFFLASPNLTIHRVKGIDQAFQFSDHQPVRLEILLQ